MICYTYKISVKNSDKSEKSDISEKSDKVERVHCIEITTYL